jgi:hypothetical protein
MSSAWYTKSELISDEYMHDKVNQTEYTCTCKVHNPPSFTMYIILEHPSHAIVFDYVVKLNYDCIFNPLSDYEINQSLQSISASFLYPCQWN